MSHRRIIASKFLSFENYHLAPISGLDPKSLKRAAKLARTVFLEDERKLSHGVALNHIAQTLGFKGGFGGYSAEWKGKLASFLPSNGLTDRRDVLPADIPDQCVRLSRRQIADRLFASGLPMPKRIFAGLDVFDLLRAAAAQNDLKVSTHAYLRTWGEGEWGSTSLPFAKIRPIEIRETIPPNHYVVCSEADVLHVWDILCLNNLIGDQLCDLDQESRIVAQRYNLGEGEAERIESAGRLLQRLIKLCPQGWIEVIPYNDRLAFLKAPDGGYDFVFAGMRDDKFARNPYAPYLRNKDYSKSEEASKFETYLYFSYNGWLEADKHAAENAFYAEGGTQSTYPGLPKLLQKYLTQRSVYSPSPRKAPIHPGYLLSEVEGRAICISPLITVKKFQEFLENNPDYVKHRSQYPELEPLAFADNLDSPVSVTWYDAKAYARWVKRIQKIPARLLTEEEWRALAGELIPETVTQEDARGAYARRAYTFIAPNGQPYDGHPPYMDREDFHALTLQWHPENMPKEKSEAGMEVVRSIYFGEWLLAEGAAINGLLGCSQSVSYAPFIGPVSAEAARFAPTLTGRYKSMAIGFRIAYEAEARK